MNLGDARHQLASIARVKAVFAVVAVLLLAQIALGFPESPDTIYATFGLGRDALLGGRVWQILSYAFVHGGWLHLGFNLAGVVLLGSRVEWILGVRGFLRVGLFGILLGGGFHLIASPGGVLVGFSGAVVAMLLLITTLSPESRMWPLPVSGRALGMGILVAEGFLALIDPSLGLPGFSVVGDWISSQGGASWFGIGHACHFGGGIAGWLYGRWLLRNRISMKNLRRAREREEVG